MSFFLPVLVWRFSVCCFWRGGYGRPNSNDLLLKVDSEIDMKVEMNYHH